MAQIDPIWFSDLQISPVFSSVVHEYVVRESFLTNLASLLTIGLLFYCCLCILQK